MREQLLFFAFLLVVAILGLSSVVAPVLLRTPSPFVVVMSGSMEPSLRPGDLLVIEGYSSRVPEVGDVVVFFSRRRGRVVVHRLAGVDDAGEDMVLFTKGDAEVFEDEEPVSMSDLLGSVQWRVRWLGLPSYLIWKALGRLKGQSTRF